MRPNSHLASWLKDNSPPLKYDPFQHVIAISLLAGGLPSGFNHHQFTKARTLRKHLKKVDSYSYFKPWLIGKRMVCFAFHPFMMH